MERIAKAVERGRIFVSDGAWGTQLQARGIPVGVPLELCNIERRQEVLDIARSYIAAGADMVKTNSFGGSRFKLQHYGLSDRAAELNEAAAAISREAAGPHRHVLASMGPTGRFLLMGDVTKDDLYAAFREQAVALERGGADACLIETFADIEEARCAVQAAKENTGLEVIVTFTFDRSAKGLYRTLMGVSPQRMAEAMQDAGADLIGTNCGHGVERMVEILREIRDAAPEAPLVVHTNAGLPVLEEEGVTYPETPEFLASFAPRLIDAGARVIGGCCGTTPAHIRALAAAVRAYAPDAAG